MRKHRCPGGVKVARFPEYVRGLGFDSRVRTLFSIDLCCIPGGVKVEPCVYHVIHLVFTLLSACTVKRGAPSTASCLTHS